ncbi:MAG: GxxExxY protein [Flavobacteriales bacterium]|nr:GxxExxY protein [Flavobacteriales bacterium]MCB9173258.1 GxxExxY protein [Flavobacteriales bacterium]
MKEEDNISYDIRGAAFKVYNELGPGLFESVYEAAIAYELTKMERGVKTQLPIPVVYEDVKLELGFRLDLLVDDLVIIEVKSIETLLPVHHKQLLTYLKLTNKKLGLLINFNEDPIKIVRIVNNL